MEELHYTAAEDETSTKEWQENKLNDVAQPTATSPTTTSSDSSSPPSNFLSRIKSALLPPLSPSISFTSLVGATELLGKTIASPKSSYPQHLLPRFKAGRLLLEEPNTRQWVQYIFTLAGTGVTDLAMYYYMNPTDKVPVGAIKLHTAHIDVLEEMIMVITQDQTWFLCAESQKEAEEWAEKICETLENATKGQRLHSHMNGSKENHSGPRRRRLSSHVTAATVKEIQSRDANTRIDEFIEIYWRSSAEDSRLQAARGAFSWSCLRNISWRLWLGCLPLNSSFHDWKACNVNAREKYNSYVKLYPIPDFDGLFSLGQSESIRTHHFSEDLEGDDSVGAMPKSEGDERDLKMSESFVKCDTVLYEIFKDIRRTRGSMSYFREQSVQCMLIRILYIYSKLHSEISYNQGMGELLAVIVYLLHVERWRPNSMLSPSSVGRESDSDFDDTYVHVDVADEELVAETIPSDVFMSSRPFACNRKKFSSACREAIGELLMTLTDGDYMEHDAYELLEQIMKRMAPSFCPESVNCESSLISLHDQLDRIQNTLLQRCDPPLTRHLLQLGILPEVYLLRWVRVLMSREYKMYQVWHIWDAIFSLTSSDFALIDLLCVAMVRECRDDLLKLTDATNVLYFLKDANKCIEADKLIEHARELHDAMLLAASLEATSIE